MPNFTEQSVYPSGVRRIEETDPIEGGAASTNGAVNSPNNYSLQQLVNRTKWLKDNSIGDSITVPDATEAVAGKIRRATTAEAVSNSPSNNLALSPSKARSIITSISPTISYATTSAPGIVRFPSLERVLEGTSQTLVPNVLRANQFAESTLDVTYGEWETNVGGTNWGSSGDYTYQDVEPFFIKIGDLVIAFVLISFPTQSDKTTHFYGMAPAIKPDSSIEGFCLGNTFYTGTGNNAVNQRDTVFRIVSVFSRSTFSSQTSIKVVPSYSYINPYHSIFAFRTQELTGVGVATLILLYQS